MEVEPEKFHECIKSATETQRRRELFGKSRSQPQLDLIPHRRSQDVVVARGGNHDQPFRLVKRVEDAPRVIDRSVAVLFAMNQQHWHREARRGSYRAYVVDDKMSGAFRAGKRGTERPRWKVERAFRRNRPKIGERRGRDDGSHSRLDRRSLKSHRRAQRVADQHDTIITDLIEDPLQVTFLEISVRAAISARVAVPSAVVGHYIEAKRQERRNRADRAAAIVCDAVQVDDRPSVILRARSAVPSTQLDIDSGKHPLSAGIRRLKVIGMTCRKQQGASANRRQAARPDPDGDERDAENANKSDSRRLRHRFTKGPIGIDALRGVLFLGARRHRDTENLLGRRRLSQTCYRNDAPSMHELRSSESASSVSLIAA